MTRRERLERKAELRREWAAKRAAQSAAAYQKAHAAVEHIPLGQPILVGHHSERMHRAALSRSDSAMRQSCESQAMAAHHESKADGIERQLDKCVFSDDPDAIEQLQAKIDDAERLQTAMKAANAIVRKKPKNESTPEKLAALQALGLSEDTARQLFEADFCGRIGFPDYRLQNNNANIRRMKERIAYIGKINADKQAAEEAPSGVVVQGTDWVRITFADKPSRDVLNDLKGAGFRWGSGSWSGKRDDIPDSVRRLMLAGLPC